MEVKSYVIKYFKAYGYQLRSENAILLANVVKELEEDEWKPYLDKILINVQNQTNIVANSIEKENVLAAIKVTYYLICN